MDEKATIYDYARMCKTYHTNCLDCPMRDEVCTFCIMDNTQVDKANEIILNWCKTHPVKTRQSKLLKIIPTARIDEYGVAKCKPCEIDDNITCNGRYCTQCRKEYWSEEVEENV